MLNNKQLKKLIVFYLSLLAIGVIYIVIYRTLGFGIPCIFNYYTGLDCISCGVTRMINSILYGRFFEAFCYNQFLFLSFPFIIFYFIKGSILYVKQKKLAFSKTDNIIFTIFIIIGVIFAILRNI